MIHKNLALLMIATTVTLHGNNGEHFNRHSNQNNQRRDFAAGFTMGCLAGAVNNKYEEVAAPVFLIGLAGQAIYSSQIESEKRTVLLGRALGQMVTESTMESVKYNDFKPQINVNLVLWLGLYLKDVLFAHQNNPSPEKTKPGQHN